MKPQPPHLIPSGNHIEISEMRVRRWLADCGLDGDFPSKSIPATPSWIETCQCLSHPSHWLLFVYFGHATELAEIGLMAHAWDKTLIDETGFRIEVVHVLLAYGIASNPPPPAPST